MSSHARARGADSALPFGAGLGVSGSEGAATSPAPPVSGDRTPPDVSGAPQPAGRGAWQLEAFLGGERGQALDPGRVGALMAPLAEALSAAAAEGRLDDAMGPAAGDPRFSPGAREVEAAWRVTEAVSAGHSSFGATAVAVALQPSEPFAYLGARVLRALEVASRVLLIGHPELPGVDRDLRAALAAAGVEGTRLAALDGADGSVLREAASHPTVAVDLVDFDPVEGLTLGRLHRLRGLAARGAAEEGAGKGGGVPGAAGPDLPDGDWFGLGAIGRPTTPIVSRPRLARQLTLGIDSAAAGGALGEHDLAESAEQAVDRAFGRSALGGFASDAVTSVLVRPQLLSRFTACLLETLDETKGDPWFTPPPWVQRAPRALPLRDVAAGRRRVLDEGATLIHERELPSGETCGLVLTNVERRMKLAGEMSVPGTLFLVRAFNTDGGQ